MEAEGGEMINFGELITGLYWVCAIALPLALWKVIDILIWLFTHISIDWN